jgi:hypothetical protein
MNSTVASFGRQVSEQAAVFSGWDAKSTPMVIAFLRLLRGIVDTVALVAVVGLFRNGPEG